MLQKDLGMFPTVINLHFICSVLQTAFLITLSGYYYGRRVWCVGHSQLV